MYKQGVIVLIPFPFTDLTGSKIRPALIIGKKSFGEDVIVSFISSNAKEKSSYDVIVNPSNTNGLKVISLIKGTKVATLDKKMIIGEIGELENIKLKEVQKILKTVLF